MKNLGKKGPENGQKTCKTSEVFCKPSNLENDIMNENNSLRMTCSCGHDDVQMTCKTHNSFVNQRVDCFEDEHSKHPLVYTRGEFTLPPVLNPLSANLVVVRKIDFDRAPEIGTVLMREGQRYELIETTPHTKANGEPTTILSWLSHCADCAQPFVVTSGLRASMPVRRCKAHRRAGVAVVKAKRGYWRRQGGAK